MQFHLDGFKTGNPEIAEAAPQARARRGNALPDEVDVLIVGSGPTGLTLAAQLAAFPAIATLVVEQNPGPLQLGQADGIACRTVEMFEAFGFAHKVLHEAYWVNETTFWKPDDADRANIVRSGRIQDTEDGLSEFPHVILNQARVHDFYLEAMRHSPSRLEPDYSRRLLDLTVSDDAGHPVTARFERTAPEHRGQIETVRARFAVGCDGAHSAVRKSLGMELRGESANQAWGVMDVLAVTDFPDVRLKSAIHSAAEGSMLIIPREGGYLVRLYIELDKLSANERIASRHVTAEHLVAAARRILHPYTLDVKEIAWWSVYEIGQRLCDKFDDVPEQDEHVRLPRVFIAGDACHTHSPKAGQGMNVSMQDGFNLGWKLASVLRGLCSPQILHTYTTERQTVAAELIDFDRQFAAGTETRYYPSIISAEPTHQELARGCTIGMRFHSAPVLRLADARPMHLGHAVKADGRWRVFAFAGPENPAAPDSAIRALCDFLASSPASPVVRYTQQGADIDSVIDLRAVFQQPHRELAVDAMPPLLLPRKGRYGLIDHEKMFCPDLGKGQDIFEMRGIDRAGCIVVVRPDQYVAHVLPLDAHGELAGFFDGFMVTKR